MMVALSKKKNPLSAFRCRLGKRVSRLHPPKGSNISLELPIKYLTSSGTDSIFPDVVVKEVPLVNAVKYGILGTDEYLLPESTFLNISPSLGCLIPAVTVQDVTEQFVELTRISDDLFVPLGRLRKDGKDYRRKDRAPEQLSFGGEMAGHLDQGERVDGYRKAFSRVQHDRHHSSVKQPSIWDMLLPMLQPPVDNEFVDILDFPLRCNPYPYQWDGIKFLVENEGALLGDDMGTGKTVQSILAMRLLFQRGTVKTALIVSPLSVLRHWDRELEKWSPDLQVTVVRGNREHRRYCWQYMAHVWVTTYDTLRQDMGTDTDSLKEKFDLVIVDETQRIKNPGTGITKAVRNVKCHYRWGLSGTPIENRLDELVSIYAFLKPGLLTYEGITPEFAREAIQPYFLRRRKADVLKDLPEKHEFPVYLRFEDEQMASYRQMERDKVLHLREQGETVKAGNILTLITELKKLCNRDRATGKSAKLTWLMENMEDMVTEGDKALIFSQYKEEQFGGTNWLESELMEFGALNYSQATSDSKKQAYLHSFKTDETKKVFIGNPRTAGVGLNDLVAANYVVHFDHWWNPAVANQATDRAHRPGQTKDVFVYHLWVEDTIEELIRGKLEEKQLLYDTVIDSLSKDVTEGFLFDIYDDLLSKHGFKMPRLDVSPTEAPPTGRSLAVGAELDYGSPRDFEKLVAELFNRMGYQTRLTPVTNDRGVDVIGVREVGLSLEKIAIQCKLVGSPVGRPVLQQLLGVLSADPAYTKGLLVTNSRLSREAVAMLRENGRLQAIEGQDLRHLMQKHGLL